MQGMPVHDALRLGACGAGVFAAGQTQLTPNSKCNSFAADHALDAATRVGRFGCLDGFEVVLYAAFRYLGAGCVGEDVAPIEV